MFTCECAYKVNGVGSGWGRHVIISSSYMCLAETECNRFDFNV